MSADKPDKTISALRKHLIRHLDSFGGVPAVESIVDEVLTEIQREYVIWREDHITPILSDNGYGVYQCLDVPDYSGPDYEPGGSWDLVRGITPDTD